MRRVPRARELLAFDLALSRIGDPAGSREARPCDAPFLFPGAERLADRSAPALVHPERGGRTATRPRTGQPLRLVGFDEAGRGALAGPVVVGCVQIPQELLDDASRVEALLGGVDDSKRLTPRAREATFSGIVGCARWAFGCASASEVDTFGIVAAAERAAHRAVRRLGASFDLAVFDRGLSLGAAVALDPSSLDSLSSLGCRDESRAKPTEHGSKVRGNEVRGSGKSNGLVDPTEFNEPSGLSLGFPPGVAFTHGDMRSLHVAAASIVAKVTRDHLLVHLDSRFPGFGLARHKGYGTALHVRAIAELGPSPVHRHTFVVRSEEPKSQSC